MIKIDEKKLPTFDRMEKMKEYFSECSRHLGVICDSIYFEMEKGNTENLQRRENLLSKRFVFDSIVDKLVDFSKTKPIKPQDNFPKKGKLDIVWNGSRNELKLIS
jgi:hypothetical protein|tara:strand:+ start:1217 stop:1531 length:315 start_codon:yes stop_codon:yes gene_type:complete